MKLKEKRALRVRKKIRNDKRIRLCVTRSNKNIYVQLIDDKNQKTIVGIGSTSKQNKDKKLSLKETALLIGKQISEYAVKKKIKKVVFDRGCLKYHGIVKILADEARKKLEF